MNFNPFPGSVETPEVVQSLEKEIVIEPGIAWPFQLDLMGKYFTNEAGEPIKELNDEVVLWWTQKYGKAFREYCEDSAHRGFAQAIIDSKGSMENLSPEAKQEIPTLVAYMKEHPEAEEVIH